MNQKLQNYQAIDTLGKSMPELIIKVYDGAIYNFAKAIEFYKADNFQDGYDSMEGAKKFIVHLYTSLDKKRGGEIAENLSKLYAYIVERISFVEATKDIASIEDCILILNNVKEGWAQLVKDAKIKPEALAPISNTAPIKRVSISA